MAANSLRLRPGSDGKFSSTSVTTGAKHTFIVERTKLELDHRYHDDMPVEEAPFEVELESGRTFQGTLDKSGRAELFGFGRPKSVKFGPDARPYTLADTTSNPAYKEKLSEADIDSLIAPHVKST